MNFTFQVFTGKTIGKTFVCYLGPKVGKWQRKKAMILDWRHDHGAGSRLMMDADNTELELQEIVHAVGTVEEEEADRKEIAEGTRAHVRNTISFVEFETMVSIDGNTDDLKEIYAMFDEDGDGYISAIELEHAMQILVTKGVVTHAEVDHMVTAKAKGGIVAIGICHKVRKTPSWSRSWANFSLV